MKDKKETTDEKEETKEERRDRLFKLFKGEKYKEFEKLLGEKGQVAFTGVIVNYHDKLDLIKQFIKEIPVFYDKSGLFWWWNHGRFSWEIVDEIDILNFIDYMTPANIISSKDRNEIILALKQIGRRQQPIPVKETWIQFGEEIVDIKTGERFKATPKYFVVNQIPYALGRSDETPTIDKLFEDWVGKDNIQILYEILSYSLLPDYPIQRLFCFIGSGSNGKTCFMNLARKFIGDENYTTTDFIVSF